MSDWSEVAINPPARRPRKDQDFLPLFNDLMVLWDFLGSVVTGGIALRLYGDYVLRVHLDFSTTGPFLRDIAFGSFIAAAILRMPRAEFHYGLRSIGAAVMAAERRCTFAFVLLITVGTATRSTNDLARLWLVSWFLCFSVVVACTRTAAGLYLRGLARRGQLREAIAIVGTQGARERVAARVSQEAEVVGLFNSDFYHADTETELADELSHLIELGRQGVVDSVIVALDYGQAQHTAQIIERLKAMPVQVAVCPDDSWTGHRESQTRLLGGVAMTVVADRPIKQWDLLIKTAIDKLVAALLLLALLPMFVGISMAIAISSPGPVIFRQKRRGWSGTEFVIYKFRTMRVGAAESRRQTMRGDPRCTPIGRRLRHYSLDELPQLWNVLAGDMSLVGPRPHAEALHELDRAGKKIVAEYAQRHRVKPGLTGWAQVNGARGATTSLAQLQRRVVYDLYYVENWSLWLDMKILARTPFCLSGENAF